MIILIIFRFFFVFSFEILFFILVLIVFLFNNFSWIGFFFKVDGGLWFILNFLCVLLLIFLNWTEKNYVLLVIGNFLIFFSFLFFFSRNFLFLYIFFELTLFPIVLIILIFGRQIEKISSSYYLIFYTVFCRFPWLASFFLFGYDLILNYLFLFLSWEVLFFFSLLFIVKFPIYFFHLWLPKAHVEASTRARILLAAILLKLGTGGLFRVLFIFNFNNLIVWFIVGSFGIFLGTINCFLQRDSKSLLAFSSVIHINFLLFILLILNNYVKRRCITLIISHGFISSLIFFFIGEFYKFRRTRFIFYFKNLVTSSIIFFYLVVFCILANRAVPFRISFFLELIGVYRSYFSFVLFFFILGLYFFFRFYASFFLLVNGIIGKGFINYKNMNFFFFYFFNLLRYLFLFFLFLFSVFILNKIW